jgi:hypothetical protein
MVQNHILSRIRVPNRCKRDFSTLVLLGSLALAGCASGIKQTEQLCAPTRGSAASYADCLRVNYATLTSGSPSDSDLGALYLAEAEYMAAQVAAGRTDDSMAMLELAKFRSNVIAQIEQKRRDQNLQTLVKALQSSGNSGGQSGGSGRNSNSGNNSYSSKDSYSSNNSYSGNNNSYSSNNSYSGTRY